MDALDLNWCLTCGCHIELEGSPYCSSTCINSDKPSASTLTSYPTVSSFLDRESLFDDEQDYHYEAVSQDVYLPSPSLNTWIGQGNAGIRAWAQTVPRGALSDAADCPSGTLKPKLLLQYRRPVKPSLCMSRAQPALPEPSRPILTPQQTLPSLSHDSNPSTSMVSLTTGSSYSVATPATPSEVGSLHDAPLSVHHHNFLGGLKAQLRAWASSSTPQKEAIRSNTATRRPAVHIVDDSSSESVYGLPKAKVRRPRSPAPFFVMPEQFPAKRREDTRKQENASRRSSTEDHPVYRTRGRKVSRIAS